MPDRDFLEVRHVRSEELQVQEAEVVTGIHTEAAVVSGA